MVHFFIHKYMLCFEWIMLNIDTFIFALFNNKWALKFSCLYFILFFLKKNYHLKCDFVICFSFAILLINKYEFMQKNYTL